MNFITKIFEGKFDDKVHLQFQKFSKGEFRDRALIEVKKSKDKYTIKTSAEFSNELVRVMAEKLGSEKTNVSGAIVSTLNLEDEIEFKEKKQFQGVKRYLIDKEMSGDELISLLDNNPKAFFALSFAFGNEVLKVKPKAPKSGKPGKGDEKPKVDFCSLKTTDKEIAKSFIFETSEFHKAEANHTFLIESIEVPEELKDSKDFAKVREESRRKGKIIRKAIVDEKEKISEKEFEV
ncbi:MAG: hypothetical protein WDZ77_00500 [Candidatus Pacearchaeota archaeon]